MQGCYLSPGASCPPSPGLFEVFQGFARTKKLCRQTCHCAPPLALIATCRQGYIMYDGIFKFYYILYHLYSGKYVFWLIYTILIPNHNILVRSYIYIYKFNIFMNSLYINKNFICKKKKKIRKMEKVFNFLLAFCLIFVGCLRLGRFR